MTYKDELTIKLQQFGVEPTDAILRFIDLETIPLKSKIFNLTEALSKAEDNGEVNNCDGCRSGMPLSMGIYHINDHGKVHMICSKERYASQPTNSLDELSAKPKND